MKKFRCNYIIKLIAVFISFTLIFNDAAFSLGTSRGKARTLDTLSSTSRVEPLTTVSWDAEDYSFDTKDSSLLRAAFRRKSGLFFAISLIGGFLVDQRELMKRDLTPSEAKLKARFRTFCKKLMKSDTLKHFTFEEFDYFLVDGSKGASRRVDYVVFSYTEPENGEKISLKVHLSEAGRDSGKEILMPFEEGKQTIVCEPADRVSKKYFEELMTEKEILLKDDGMKGESLKERKHPLEQPEEKIDTASRGKDPEKRESGGLIPLLGKLMGGFRWRLQTLIEQISFGWLNFYLISRAEYYGELTFYGSLGLSAAVWGGFIASHYAHKLFGMKNVPEPPKLDRLIIIAAINMLTFLLPGLDPALRMIVFACATVVHIRVNALLRREKFFTSDLAEEMLPSAISRFSTKFSLKNRIKLLKMLLSSSTAKTLIEEYNRWGGVPHSRLPEADKLVRRIIDLENHIITFTTALRKDNELLFLEKCLDDYMSLREGDTGEFIYSKLALTYVSVGNYCAIKSAVGKYGKAAQTAGKYISEIEAHMKRAPSLGVDVPRDVYTDRSLLYARKAEAEMGLKDYSAAEKSAHAARDAFIRNLKQNGEQNAEHIQININGLFDSYTSLINLACKVGKHEKAFVFYDEALSAVHDGLANVGEKHKVSIFLQAATFVIRNDVNIMRRFSREEIIRFIEKHMRIIPPSEIGTLSAQMLSAWVAYEGGDIESAARMVENLEVADIARVDQGAAIASEIYEKLAFHYLLEGKPEEAEKFAKTLFKVFSYLRDLPGRELSKTVDPEYFRFAMSVRMEAMQAFSLGSFEKVVSNGIERLNGLAASDVSSRNLQKVQIIFASLVYEIFEKGEGITLKKPNGDLADYLFYMQEMFSAAQTEKDFFRITKCYLRFPQRIRRAFLEALLVLATSYGSIDEATRLDVLSFLTSDVFIAVLNAETGLNKLFLCEKMLAEEARQKETRDANSRKRNQNRKFEAAFSRAAEKILGIYPELERFLSITSGFNGEYPKRTVDELTIFLQRLDSSRNPMLAERAKKAKEATELIIEAKAAYEKMSFIEAGQKYSASLAILDESTVSYPDSLRERAEDARIMVEAEGAYIEGADDMAILLANDARGKIPKRFAKRVATRQARMNEYTSFPLEEAIRKTAALKPFDERARRDLARLQAKSQAYMAMLDENQQAIDDIRQRLRKKNVNFDLIKEKLVKILSEDDVNNQYDTRVGELLVEVSREAYIRKAYGKVFELAGACFKYVEKWDIRERVAEINRLQFNSRIDLAVRKLEPHFDILDCQVTSDNLKTEERLRALGDTRTGGKLEYHFKKMRQDEDSGEIILSKFSYYKTAKNRIQLDEMKTRVSVGENYVLIIEVEKGENKQFFIKVSRSENGEVFVEIENDSLREEFLEILPKVRKKGGVIKRVQDFSLVRRKQLLESLIQHMKGLISQKGNKLTTGYPLIDIALGIKPATDPTEHDTPWDITCKDARIETDPVQKEAVRLATHPFMNFMLIQGPPGTGKTSVITEIIRQLSMGAKKILVVSQSNAGVDNVAERFLDLERRGEGRIEFARVGNRVDDSENLISKELLANWKDRKITLDKMERTGGCVVLGTNNGFLLDRSINSSEFYSEGYDVVIIEEAGRATVAETLLPISVVKDTGKVILVGDHRQLPSYGIDREQIGEIKAALSRNNYLERRTLDAIFSHSNVSRYKTSLFEVLWESKNERNLKRGVHKHLLKISRRSHPAIAKLVSLLFYSDDPIEVDPEKDPVPESDTITLIDYAKDENIDYSQPKDGLIYEEEAGTSSRNTREVNIVLGEIDRFLAQRTGEDFRYKPEDIMIISPYKAQGKLIKQALEVKAIINDIEDRKLDAEELFMQMKMTKLERAVNPDQLGQLKKDLSKLQKAFKKGHDIQEELTSVKNALYFNTKREWSRRSISWKDLADKKIKILEVETVDSIQGGENKVVILSLVKSNSSAAIGFMGTPDGLQRLNVAFSRAQEKFTIIGDFTHTLARYPTSMDQRNGREIHLRRSKDTFIRTMQYVEELKKEISSSGSASESEVTVKDVGGREADNETVVNPHIRNAIKDNEVTKLSFLGRSFYYAPRYMPIATSPHEGDVRMAVPPSLKKEEEARLKSYIMKALEEYPPLNGTPLYLADIIVGILQERAFVTPGSGEDFSIVHAGERNGTIWFGEAFLKELLSEDNDPDAEFIFEHDIKHITQPDIARSEHDEALYREKLEKIKKRCEVVRGEVKTQTFLDNLAERAYTIDDEEKLLIAIEDGECMPDKQHLQGLLNAICRLSGKDNIVILRGRGKALAKSIRDEVGENFSNVIVLGSPNTINSQAFSDMKSTKKERKACMIAIDPSEYERILASGEKAPYIRIIEMLLLSLELAYNSRILLEELQRKYPHITIVPGENPRTFTFIPKAEALDHNELKDLYEHQLAVILSA